MHGILCTAGRPSAAGYVQSSSCCSLPCACRWRPPRCRFRRWPPSGRTCRSRCTRSWPTLPPAQGGDLIGLKRSRAAGQKLGKGSRPAAKDSPSVAVPGQCECRSAAVATELWRPHVHLRQHPEGGPKRGACRARRQWGSSVRLCALLSAQATAGSRAPQQAAGVPACPCHHR